MSNILNVYDKFFFFVFKTMRNLYNNKDFQLVYTVYVITFFAIVLFIVPFQLLLEKAINIETNSTLAWCINAVLSLSVYLIHFKRYSNPVIVENLIKSSKGGGTIDVFFLIVILCIGSFLLWLSAIYIVL